MGTGGRVEVQITGNVGQLDAAMSAAESSVKRASATMVRETETMNGAFEGMAHRFEHSGVMIAFAVNNMMDGTQKGVDRALHSIALLGFAFGPVVGAVTTAVALILEQIKHMVQEADKEIKNFQKSLVAMGNAGEVAQLQKKMQDLLVGTPLDPETGEVRAKSELVPGAWAGSLEDLRAKIEQLKATGMKGFTIIPGALTKEVNKQEEELRKLTTAIDAAETQREHLARGGALPNVTVKEESADRIKREWAKLTKEIDKLNLETALHGEQAMEREEKRGVDAAIREMLREGAERDKHQHKREQEQVWLTTMMERTESEHAVTLQHSLDKIQRENERKAEEIAAQWERAFQRVENAFVNAFDKLKQHGGSFRDFMRTVGQQLLADFVRAQLRMVEAHIAANLAKTASDTDTAAKGKVIAIADALTRITKNAAAAAASVYSGTVEFLSPVMGPASMLPAAVAAGAAFAAVEAFGALASAAQGYDIPAGLNAIAQLHAQEMVLPAPLANAVRGMAEGGGGGGAVHLHVHALDAADVAGWARRNTATIGAAAMAHVQRGGMPAGAAGRNL